VGVRIGCATAWSGDRFSPADVLVRDGDLDYLFFESMSEATMSLAQLRRAANPDIPAYDPFLQARMRPILAGCVDRSVTIISNQGWLDPTGAAAELMRFAAADGIHGLRVAAIVPTPFEPLLSSAELRLLETGELVSDHLDAITSAEPYLGAWEIVEALRAGANVVITPRVTDASLVLAPLIHELGWGREDWDNLARGVIIGHLLECGTQITGGFFADPGYKDVTGLADMGHPIADVDPDRAVITKPDGTGGLVSAATCKEQLLYEVGDPAHYLNPDVTSDFTNVSFAEIGPDRVQVLGGRGGPPPATLKVLIGIREGYFSEEMMLYAGPGAADRARLAEQIVRERLDQLNLAADAVRFDYVGVNSIHREATPPSTAEPYEVALRVAVRARSREEIAKLGLAVAPMAVSGPAGTGKWGTLNDHIRPVVGMYSTSVSREAVPASIAWYVS
jgi:hypothetical protein